MGLWHSITPHTLIYHMTRQVQHDLVMLVWIMKYRYILFHITMQQTFHEIWPFFSLLSTGKYHYFNEMPSLLHHTIFKRSVRRLLKYIGKRGVKLMEVLVLVHHMNRTSELELVSDKERTLKIWWDLMIGEERTLEVQEEFIHNYELVHMTMVWVYEPYKVKYLCAHSTLGRYLAYADRHARQQQIKSLPSRD